MVTSRYLVPLALLAVLLGCAHTTRERLYVDNVEVVSVYDKIAPALVSCGYTILHSDKASGVVTAGRNAENLGTGREVGRQLRVSVAVIQESRNVLIFLTWTPPEMAFGGFEGEQDELVKSLQLLNVNAIRVTNN
jgi:hypothetical protein